MIYRIEQDENDIFYLVRNSDNKAVSSHETYELAEYAEQIRLDYLAKTDNLCDCGDWKSSDYPTCYDCR